MRRYVLGRLLLAIPTLLGITLVVFAAVRFLPGDVIDQMAGEYGGANPELRARLMERYALNTSLPDQYVRWVVHLFGGDLGTSIVSGRAITRDLRQRLPPTFELGLLALIVALIIAVPVGVLSSVRQDTVLDYLARSFAIGLLAVPSFWLGLLAITYGFVWFGWTPPLQFHQLWADPAANLQTLWVPAVILGAALSGTIMRLTRSTMLEVLRQDYIRTAWAKGLGTRAVVSHHALRNAAIPVVTVVGLQTSLLIGGTVILERIFSIPGMGSYLLSSIQQRDYPVVQAIVLLSAVVVVASNLAVDLTYAAINPRIRYA